MTDLRRRFMDDMTLRRPWLTLKILRGRPQQKLPVVLDPKEAKRLLAVQRSPVARMCATLMYCCGLRISEALRLQVADMDSQRMVVIVRGGTPGNGSVSGHSASDSSHSEATSPPPRPASSRPNPRLGHRHSAKRSASRGCVNTKTPIQTPS
jgi:integrase